LFFARITISQNRQKEQAFLSKKPFSQLRNVGYMIGAGRLHEAQRLSQQAMLLETELEVVLPEVGCPALFQAEILREWNQLDTALFQAQEAIALCKQGESIASLAFLLYEYAVLMRICLSRRDYGAACSALLANGSS
ncbi:MAG TPA: hypothetical protein VN207_09910, partial [Ktedonobacteraceae bacterium]|nr:hypothetical protein [Ktedonobacteraceae bacterium]